MSDRILFSAEDQLNSNPIKMGSSESHFLFYLSFSAHNFLFFCLSQSFLLIFGFDSRPEYPGTRLRFRDPALPFHAKMNPWFRSFPNPFFASLFVCRQDSFGIREIFIMRADRDFLPEFWFSSQFFSFPFPLVSGGGFS